MKLPNHYGSIVKLSGKRRKPFAVKEGRTGLQKIIGYAATREEALKVLAEYNGQPWDVDQSKVTLEDVFHGWLKSDTAARLSKGTVSGYSSAWPRLESVKSRPFLSLRQAEVQLVMDGLTPCQAQVLRALMFQLDRFALVHELIPALKFPALDAPKVIQKHERHIFSDDEVSALWSEESETAKDLLVLLYTGFRVSEAESVTSDSFDETELTLKAGVKTEAGKNRLVPVHERILPLIRSRLESFNRIILSDYKTLRTYANSLGHVVHETRHTFRTWLDNAGANKVSIDRIMGHASKGTGERIYTHKSIENLRTAIKLITN